ncbi:ATP-grasp domain-containing protein [Amycolatopsis xylanica]|uniref:ATP-grasp domain-containing protein n=1 Tax=Amycolatopsis xylanica TaxID=589385 RepID=A0A1H3KAQ6_9PSEU|nr:ATP-grasp domain-containing protein [Amycolatopsis xylanica]SDY49230.1 ATP-grasp domain-containing protein [Amycolatopsis xylanica]
MTKERVLIIGGSPDLLRKAARSGLSITYFQKPGHFDPRSLRFCDQVHLIDFQRVQLAAALAKSLHSVEPFVRVLTQTESALLISAHISDHLNLTSGDLNVARTLHDKRKLRKLLNDANLGPVGFSCGGSLPELAEFVRRHGPSVVKPAMGSGSLGFRRILSPDELAATWEWMAEVGMKHFMMEELLVGPEYSVETYSRDGEHTVLGITEKHLTAEAIEIGHVFPAALGTDVEATVAEFVAEVLAAVGLRDGLTHTEIILTSGGPRIVEAHNRRGGGRINDLVSVVRGVDMESLYFSQPSALVGLDPPSGAAATWFVHARPGRVVSISGLDAVRGMDGVLDARLKVRPGDLVRPLQWSEDRCGHVVAHGKSAHEARRIAQRAAESIEIQTVSDSAAVELTLAERLDEVGEILDPFMRDYPAP